jgi:CBS domain-containing protein
MPDEVVAADEKVEKTYLRRLYEALRLKGFVVLAGVPAALAASSVAPALVPPLVVGTVATLLFSLATVVDSKKDPASRVDTVGVAFVVASAAYTGIVLNGYEVMRSYSVVAAGLVLGAVAYEYLSKGGDGIREIHETSVDPLHLDIVGFVTSEILVVYAVLHATGWGGFANSPVFVILAYVFFSSTVAAFAGYAVITREIVVSRTSDEVHDAVVSVLSDIQGIADGGLRKKLALNARRIAECLDGFRIPSRVEDQYGRVPVVLSTRKPDVRRIDLRVKDVLRIAEEAEFTGYVVHGDEVFLFLNGELSKHYHEGRYTEDTGGIEESIEDASFFSLEYPTAKNLAEITPGEGDITEPEGVVEEIEDKEVDESAKFRHALSIGGDDVDVKEMFSLTEELVEESPKQSPKRGLDVGGEEIDVDEIMERADDVIEELSDS